MNSLPKEVEALDFDHKVQLIDDLSLRVAQEYDQRPMSDALKAELDRRLEAARARPSSGVTLAQIAAKVGVKL